ncbi:hypothetical protein BDY24DRAFT_416749 [Mrakia frigida]|uniref:uncharacterized protein n=1 Tax=Mrakia frigida TaxID=29902 RepID=UPI003FCC21F9
MDLFRTRADELALALLSTSNKLEANTIVDAQTSHSPLPTLSLEVIERILKCTFLRPSKLIPASDPFHLVGSSHLLFVSKGFRELCLPFFYRCLLISRSSHYFAVVVGIGSIFALVEVVQEVFRTLAQTRLRGFPSAVFEEFSSWSNRNHAWRSKCIRPIESWTWELENGEVVSLGSIALLQMKKPA